MLNHYKKFIEKAELPQDGGDYLLASGERIYFDYKVELLELIEVLYTSGFCMNTTEPGREAIAEASGIHIYTINAAFIIFASKRMLADYIIKGISEDIYWNTILDLKCKLQECKTVKGIWGTFVEGWYGIFFSLDIYKLGRLEFERIKFDEDFEYRCGDTIINKGDTVYSVHIPSSGSISYDMCMNSYKQAYEFFATERGKKPLICICNSWLLCPVNKEIFPEGSNLLKFMENWDVVHTQYFEEFHDAWRIFGCDYTGDISCLPKDTSLQRAMAAWITKGGKTGEGIGMLIFDGEKIIH